MKRKFYIFLTANIHPIGGMQNYVAGKMAYLKQQGWEVRMFFCGEPYGNCAMPALNDYVNGGMMELIRQPGEWTKGIQNKVIQRMRNIIGPLYEGETVLIESQTDVLALWGEILAKELHGKNMCFICNELFEGKWKCYKKHLDFFDFKHRRKELTGIQEESLDKLFGDYKKLLPEERYWFEAANEGPVQEIENDLVDKLERADWDIGYIGRSEKLYVSNIIKGVFQLAQKHRDKQIQFIMVGDAEFQKALLEQTLEKQENVSVIRMGDLVPIPRKLFKKLDVVVAGAGCAVCAAEEGVPTIIADAENGLANGILGYTTFSTIFHDQEKQISFDQALEQVLIDKIQERMEYKFPKSHKASYYYKQHMDFIEDSCKQHEYYKNVRENARIQYGKVWKYRLGHAFPFLAKVYKRAKVTFHKANAKA